MPDAFLMRYLADRPETRELLKTIFERMRDEGTLTRTFYDGTVRTAEEFVADVLRMGSLPFAIYWEGCLAGFCWLNTFEGRSARGHYVFFRRFWGRKTSARMGRRIYEYLLTLRDDRGYLFDLVLGLTPKQNAVAWKLPLLCGAFVIGDIPHGAFMANEGRTVDAVLTGVTRESLGFCESGKEREA